MSFSSLVKSELCRLEVTNECCLLAELAAAVRISGNFMHCNDKGSYIRLITENAAFARRIYSNIKRIFNINPEVLFRRSNKLKRHASYMLVIPNFSGMQSVFQRDVSCSSKSICESLKNFDETERICKSECCRRSYLRGAFLAGGSISDPEKMYHLEITSRDINIAVEIENMMNSFNLNARIVGRKGNFVTYLKEGENIVDFLNIIGAHSALLELENIRILKEMRNNVNRIVNCETANLEKTVKASVRQVENIKLIHDTIGLENLPDNLREIAELRLEHSEVNLKELGEMLNPPLGKSGVNHRLRKLDEIAEGLRAKKTTTS